jgi:hypothetical protein
MYCLAVSTATAASRQYESAPIELAKASFSGPPSNLQVRHGQTCD